jgi:hypothetical protein
VAVTVADDPLQMVAPVVVGAAGVAFTVMVVLELAWQGGTPIT